MDETYIPWGTYELHVGCNRYDVDVAVEAAEHHSGIKRHDPLWSLRVDRRQPRLAR